MTAATRTLPDSTNGSPPYDALTWQRKANTEVGALWQVSATYLISVGGTANAITATSDTTLVAAIAAYARPMAFWLVPTLDNIAATTINIDGKGVKSILDIDGNALAGGELAAGGLYLIVYDGSNFRLFSGSGASANVSVAPGIIVRDEKTTATNGGTFTSGAWQTRTLNTSVRNVIAGAALASNQVTLQAGTYLVEWSAPAANGVQRHQTRWQNITDGSTVETGTSEYAGTQTTRSIGLAVITITTAKVYELQHRCEVTVATSGFGLQFGSGAKEVYSWVNIWKVGSLASQVDGVPGGGITFPILFSTTTADADPGAGTLRLNNATQNAATTAYVDLSDANLTDITALLDSLASNGDKVSRGQVRLVKYDDPTKWLVFNVTAWTTATGYRKLTLAIIGQSAASPFADADRLFFLFTRTGNVGPGGAVSIPYTFSTTTTDADPGAGFLRLDNATQGSATTIRADLSDNLGTDWTAVLDTLDASTSSVKARVRLRKLYDPTAYILFDLTARAAPSGYRNLTVSFVGQSGANPFANNDAIVMDTTRVGDKGATGATGSIGTLNANTAGFALINGTITASVAASALTVAVKGQDGNDPSGSNHVYAVFRDPTIANGGYSLLDITAALSLVVSSGSTLGTTSAIPFRLWVVLFNDASTARLGIINCATADQIYAINEGSPISSTAEGGAGAADSAGVFYTGTAVTTKSFRIIGYLDFSSGEATAGTWATAPDQITLFGAGMRKPGDQVQMVRNTTGAVATGTTVLPHDDTIPQNTEGDQYMTQAITPTSKINRLEIDAQLALSNGSASQYIGIALFQDATAGALMVSDMFEGVATGVKQVPLHHEMQAGTTSATTFKIRAGSQTAGTTTFNGFNSGRMYGGAYKSHMGVKEIMV